MEIFVTLSCRWAFRRVGLVNLGGQKEEPEAKKDWHRRWVSDGEVGAHLGKNICGGK